MKLHFLISISSVSENLFGVRFLCSFLGPYSNCDVTLFHINAPTQSNPQSALMSMWESPCNSSECPPDASARLALERSKQRLMADNINTVTTKTIREKYGKIRDILAEGANGLYDAIILGKRATYALQWLFERPGDEISQELMRHAALNNPLWICNEPEEHRKDVLLCLDGSSSAFRMADHVGCILGFVLHHHVTLLHVKTALSRDIEKILDQGEKILLSHNISSERIHRKVTAGSSAVNTILKEEQNSRVAAIAVGLNRQADKPKPPVLKLAGKTTSELVSKISKASIWCCP